MLHGLQLVLIIGTGVYHGVMGGLCLLSLENLRLLSRFLYSTQVPEVVDPKFEYGLRPLGAFALVLSLFCFRGALVLDENYRVFLCEMLALLFLLRAAFRFFYRDLFERAFGVPFRRSLKNIIFNIFLSLISIASVCTELRGWT